MTEDKIDPALISEVRRYGHFDVDACYNCGSCACVCELAEDSALFPRKSLRYVQLGLRDRLLSSLEPWLCYFCGDCSKACPRQTEPGESMMTLRRFLTAQYDWTGLSARMYKSKWWELGMIAAVGLLTGWILSETHAGHAHGTHGAGRREDKRILPMMRVHAFDCDGRGAYLLPYLKCGRFFWATMLRDGEAPPLKSYVAEL